jgi:uncharacterized protein YqjF (DUF2071 family)
MSDLLKNHPFAVEAFFESSIVLTFAVPKKEVLPLLPKRLEPDTFDDQWAFIAIAIVQTRDLRPKGFPRFFGNDFILIGYRIFVQYHTLSGKRFRGLYILKSETDKRVMTALGNIFTHYNYTQTDIRITPAADGKLITSTQSHLLVELKTTGEEVALPPASPFATWKEARRFAGPLPFTFSYNSDKDEMLLIEGVRTHWEPAPVEVKRYYSGYLERLPFSEVRLANAFVVNQVPYYWKKGRTEQWKTEDLSRVH